MIETRDGKVAVKCDGCGKVIEHSGTMANESEHFCDECSTPANQEFRICTVCGKPMVSGMTDDGAFFCHEECLDEAMDAEFPGGWREVADDGCGGNYEWYDQRECEWCGTGIYYTEWY